MVWLWLWLMLTIAVVILFYIVGFFLNTFSFWSKHGIKGPKPLPFFGNLLSQMLHQMHEYDINNYKEFGKVYGTFLLSYPTLNINDPSILKRIYVKDFFKFLNRTNMDIKDGITENLMVHSQDDTWKKLRTKISPTFSSGKIKRMFPIMKECSKLICEELKLKAQKNEEFNANDLFGQYSMEAIARIAFATTVFNQKGQNKFIEHVNGLFKIPIVATFLLYAFPSFYGVYAKNFPSPAYKFFFDVVNHLIDDRSKQNVSGEKRVDFLQLLLDEEEESRMNTDDGGHVEVGSDANLQKSYKHMKLTRNEIVAQCILFFMAGYHTTSNALTFVFYLLATHSEEQNILYEEIKREIEMNGLNYDSFTRMPYLDAFLNEALRLYPPVSLLMRTASSAYYVEEIDFTIPEGMSIMTSTYALHRDPQYFPKPDEFIPDRFLGENQKNIKPFTYLPFGSGPRNCIGMRFAVIEMKLMICEALCAYKVEKSSKTPIFLKATNVMGLLTTKDAIIKVSLRPVTLE